MNPAHVEFVLHNFSIGFLDYGEGIEILRKREQHLTGDLLLGRRFLVALVPLEDHQRPRGVDAEIPLQQVGAIESSPQVSRHVAGIEIADDTRDIDLAVERHLHRKPVVGDGDLDVGGRLLGAMVGDQPRETVVELPAVVRVDVEPPLVLGAIQFLLDHDPVGRADRVRAEVLVLFGEQPADRPHRVFVDRELPQPLPTAGDTTGVESLTEFALKVHDFAAQIIRERQPLGEPRGDGRPRTRRVNVDLRPATVAVLVVRPTKHEHVARFEGVEIVFIETADPLVALPGEHVAAK